MNSSVAAGQRTRAGFRLLIAAAWLGTLGLSFIAGVFAYRHRDQIRSFISGAARGGQMLRTNLYNVAVQMLPIPAEGRDGGIAALDDGLLFANRRGAMWFVTADRELQPLTVRVPINVDEFEAAPYNVNTTAQDMFAVKDLLVQAIPGGVRLSASYNHWYLNRSCYVLRVSSLEATSDEIRSGSDALQSKWRTVYETQPCRPLTENVDGVRRNPTLGAGGRLGAPSDNEILVTVGGFGPERGAGVDDARIRAAGGNVQCDTGPERDFGLHRRQNVRRDVDRRPPVGFQHDTAHTHRLGLGQPEKLGLAFALLGGKLEIDVAVNVDDAFHHVVVQGHE